jgi:predicted hydrocarbon binding protein
MDLRCFANLRERSVKLSTLEATDFQLVHEVELFQKNVNKISFTICSVEEKKKPKITVRNCFPCASCSLRRRNDDVDLVQ